MAWSPAHFIVVDSQGWRAYFDGGYGEYMFARLVGGPEVAVAYVDTLWFEASSLVSWEPVQLNDFHHGGVVIDQVRRELLWFCTSSDVWSPVMAFRRVWSRLLGQMWPGWRVRWAYRGAEELAAYIGGCYVLRREHEVWQDRRLRFDIDDARVADGEELMANAFACYELLTVRRDDGTVRAWAVEEEGSRAAHLAWLGVGLFDRLPDDGWAQARMAIPMSGLHVDVPGRWVGIWTTSHVADLLTQMPRLWPGWQVSFWEDRYEEHAAAAKDAVEVAACDERAAVQGDGRFNGLKILRDPASMVEGDNLDPAVIQRARDSLTTAGAKVVAELTTT